MKISLTVVIIFTTLSVVLPYLWFILAGKNDNKKNEKLFKDVIKGENVSFNTIEQWNNNLIGIDESKNILMFIKLINQEASSLKIDLNQLKSCQINRKTRDYKKEKKMETELQSLDLELTFLFKSEIITLHFYNTNDEFSEDFELKRAEKWQTLIQQSILKSYSDKKAA
jgi:site-specific DNA-adenine methylase